MSTTRKPAPAWIWMPRTRSSSAGSNFGSTIISPPLTIVLCQPTSPTLPRWSLNCYWRKDGQPIWGNPALYADERKDYGVTEANAADTGWSDPETDAATA